MKFTLVRIQRVEVEVSIRDDSCPSCGEPFTPEAAVESGIEMRVHPLIYDGWHASRQAFSLDRDGCEVDYDAPAIVEGSIVTGVSCANCRHVLATTEGT